MAHDHGDHEHRLTAVRREGERVTPLELFFDLVFVLALTQCTALMASAPDWDGLFKGVLVLALMWWSWTAYAWLTSVVDPEEGSVRIAMFASMAALLVVALCVPEALDDLGLTFAIAYLVVRAAHIALFVIASHDDPRLRRSVTSLAASTAVGCGILIAGGAVDDGSRIALWTLALVLDVAGPFIFGASGWRLMPGHFAERHGLIVIIALGESIVAIGVGAGAHVDAGVITAAVLGIALAAAMWWAYFDVVALFAAQRFTSMSDGRDRNETARDAYSYIHFLMIAGIVLVAMGMKFVLAHVGDPLDTVPAVALSGGAALFILGNVAFKLRIARSVSPYRLIAAALLCGAIPLSTATSGGVGLGATAAVMCALAAFETTRFGDPRAEIRQQARG